MGLNKKNIQLEYSCESSDGLISEQRSIHGEFEIESVPLEVVVMLDVDGTVEKWLPEVNEEEHWHEWEDKSDPVLGETNVDDTISLERDEWVPVSLIRWLTSESNSLLSKTLNIFIDSAFHLGFDFKSLNHLNDLLLLLIGRAVLGTNFSKTLIDIVLETL